MVEPRQPSGKPDYWITAYTLSLSNRLDVNSQQWITVDG
jgi:hypothetical protein